MSILAIDPGSERSAWVLLIEGRPKAFGIEDNEALIEKLRGPVYGTGYLDSSVVIEWMTPRGMPTSAQEFETIWWIGRFTEALHPQPVARLSRAKVKLHICGSAKAKDGNVRQALIDRFGGTGGKRAAVGLKATPGPLYGVSNDVWQALALAIAYEEGIR